MNKIDIQTTLPTIHSFEEFEIFKKNTKAINEIADVIVEKHRLPKDELTLFQDGTNLVFAHGTSRVIKIFPRFHDHQFQSDMLVLKHLHGKLSTNIPQIEYEDEIAGWPYLVMNRLEGTLLEGLWENIDLNNKIVLIHELGSLIREIHSLPVNGLERIDCDWQQFINNQIERCVSHHQAMHLPESLLGAIPEYLASITNTLQEISQPVLLTGEYTPMNILVKQISGIWHIVGLIDFGDSMLGKAEYDLLGPAAFLIQGNKQLLKQFLTSYGYSADKLTSNFSHLMTALMLLHRYSNLEVQIRINDWKNKIKTLKELESVVWGFEK